MFDSDVLVVGGGIAGASTALHLARAGLRVIVYDRKHFPREKVCGEGLMPHGVRMLTELGVMQHLTADDFRTFRGIEYIIDGDVRARGEFPEIEGGYALGMGIRRFKLDAVLLEMARQHPNITVQEGVRVDGVLLEGTRALGLRTRSGDVRGRLVIGADGRGSLVRRQMHLDKAPPRRQRYGIRAHLHFQDPERVGSFVEVYKNRVGELYTTPVSEHELLVALLIEKADMDTFKGKLEDGYRDYLRSFPYLRDRFEGAEQCSAVMACGPLACAAQRPYAEGAMLVGDAAGFLDAITGEGMSLALASEKAAAETAARALADGGEATEQALEDYGPTRARITRHYYLLTSGLLYVSQHTGLARFVVKRLARAPGLFKTLLGINCGHFRWGELRWGDLRRFLIGI